MVEYSIVNIVAVSKLAESFDLDRVASTLDDTKYDGTRYPGIIWKVKEPKVGVLIFKTGKIVCTGCNNHDELIFAFDVITEQLKEVGMKIFPLPTIDVVNIVASANLGPAELKLSQVAVNLGLEHVKYEPEQFPGLVYRMKNPKVVFLIFSSGKIVCTGAKNVDDIREAIDQLESKLVEYGLL